jgi:hypothetical protein
MKSLKGVYLLQEQFDKDLETCLTIIKYPNKKKPFYVCEYISYALYKLIIKVYIIKL